MKLYYAPRSRSSRPRWLLEELGVPYELVRLNLEKKEHKSSEYLKIHPLGHVPALIDGGMAMFESGAICAYLAEKSSDHRLAPDAGTPERGLYEQWMYFAAATLDPCILQFFGNTVAFPAEKRSAVLAEEGRQRVSECATVLEQALEGKRFLVGDRFSAADVMIGSFVAFADSLGLLVGFQNLQEYGRHLSERPAFKLAYAD